MLRAIRWVLGLSALFVWTWAWFGPVGGFHHMTRLGILGWGILDREDGPAVLRWSAATLGLSGTGWLLGLGAVIAIAGRIVTRRDSAVTAP
jgi:hypothetical protein